MAAGLDDLMVIFNLMMLISLKGGLIPVSDFVIFPMGILLPRFSTLISPQGSLSRLSFTVYRSSSLILGLVRPPTLVSQLS